MYDISIILNAHKEGILLRRTIDSLCEAAEFARLFNISVELVAVLDNADAETERSFLSSDTSSFSAVQVLKVNNGSLGLSRNSGCAVAKGTYLSTADADDLISFNFFVKHFKVAQDVGPNVLLFPQYLIGFGASYFISEYGRDSKMPFLLVDQHPYISRVFFHRELFKRQQYVHCDPLYGHAYEDWHFNAEAVATGMQAAYVPQTVIYYRQRASSIMSLNRLARVELETPDSLLFTSDVYLKLFKDAYISFRKEESAPLPRHDIREKFLSNHVLARVTEAANSLEPSIDRYSLATATTWSCMWDDCEASAVYYELCEMVPEKADFSDVFLIPFLPAGGAERYILDVMNGLIETECSKHILVISGEQIAEHSWLHLLPKNVTFIDIAKIGSKLDDRRRDRLAARFIRAIAPAARIHFRSCIFAHRMLNRHLPQLANREIIYYRFCDGRFYESGISNTLGGAVEFLTNNVSYISKVITDNEQLVDEDERLFGEYTKRWRVLPAFCSVPTRPEMQNVLKKRLLWASRIDGQKRPELAVAIARTLKQKNLGIELDIYGAISPGYQIDIQGVNYKGRFNSFSELPTSEYDALVYTSWFDGLPNIILEALSIGMPVIASDVGGISEVVHHRKTGLLLEERNEMNEAIDEYLNAIDELYKCPELINRFSENARKVIVDRHGREKYLSNIKTLFGTNNVAS